MATITFEIPAEIEDRVINEFCLELGFEDSDRDGQIEFMTGKLFEHITEMVKLYETTQAVAAARAQMDESAKIIETARQVVTDDLETAVMKPMLIAMTATMKPVTITKAIG
jgi:hypothetical protein